MAFYRLLYLYIVRILKPTCGYVVGCIVRRRLFGAGVNPFDRQPSDLSPVIDAYERALLARYPRARHMPGSGALSTRILAELPEFIGDRLLGIAFKTQQTLN